MFYMVAALAWWTVLLLRQNNELLELERELLTLKNNKENSRSWEELQNDHRRSQAMVIGEGLVFIGILGIGLYFINRAYYQEISIANQQQNFLLSITHELKSPIAGMRLVYETLLKRDLSKPQQDSLIQNALQENERLEKLVNKLLLTAKIESGFKVEKEEFDLHLFLQKTIDLYRHLNPDIKIELSCHGNAVICSDRSIMRLITTNLIENAIKFTPDQGHINVEVHISDTDVLLTVKDEGPGISDTEKRKVFDKFYRTGNEDVRSTQGTGLGLYIVKQSVKILKGIIELKNNFPQGAIFTVKIPKE